MAGYTEAYHLPPPQDTMTNEMAEDVMEASFARGLAAAECFEVSPRCPTAHQHQDACRSSRQETLATRDMHAQLWDTSFPSTMLSSSAWPCPVVPEARRGAEPLNVMCSCMALSRRRPIWQAQRWTRPMRPPPSSWRPPSSWHPAWRRPSQVTDGTLYLLEMPALLMWPVVREPCCQIACRLHTLQKRQEPSCTCQHESAVLCLLLPTITKVLRGAAGTEKNMGEIVQSEVDKMDANRELQTQLRCVLLSALERTLAYTLLWNLCGLQRSPRDVWL